MSSKWCLNTIVTIVIIAIATKIIVTEKVIKVAITQFV